MGIDALIAGLVSSHHADRNNTRSTRLRRAMDGSYHTTDGRLAIRSQRHPQVMWVDAAFDERTAP
jgi:hypothetical protein